MSDDNYDYNYNNYNNSYHGYPNEKKNLGSERNRRNPGKNAGQQNANEAEFNPNLPEEPVQELERVQFLKDYARDITRTPEQVAASLKIPQQNAEEYLKYYIYMMIGTAADSTYPKRVRVILNEKLGEKPPSEHITDQELIQLKPIIERYADPQVLNSLKEKERDKQNATLNLMRKKASNAFGFGLSPNSPIPNSQYGSLPNDNSQPAGTSDFDFSAPRDTGQQSRPLSPSGRVNLMRYVLEHMPHIHHTRIGPFLDLFEAGEMKYMSSPDELFQLMTRYYGPHQGQLAFNQFKDLMTAHLKPSEQFGQNPYYGGGTQYGQPGWGGMGMGQTPNSNYYVEVGAIPPGVNPNSPEARQAIMEWRAEQKRKKSAEEMQENIKNYVNLKMMDIVDPRKQGGGPMGMGGGGGDQWMAPLLMSGAVRAVPKTGPNGEAMLSYESTGVQGQGQNGENTMLGMMRIMMEMYNAIMQQQSNAPRFLESILNTVLSKSLTQSDPFEMAMSAKKFADALTPPGGGVQQSLEAAKILLAQKKMDTDRDLTLQKMNFEHENEMYERKKQDDQEAQSSAQTNEIVKNIFSIGSQALVPLLSMFLGRGGGAGGLAGMMGGMGAAGAAGQAPPMPGMGGMGAGSGGGGGMPDMSQFMGGMDGGQEQGPTMMPGSVPVDMNQIIQQQQQAPNFNPDWAPPPSDLFGYGAGPMQPRYEPPPPPTPQQQWANFSTEPQPMTEVVLPEKNTYTAQDFENMSDEELEAYRMQGEQNRSSIDSFNNALRIAMQRRKYAPSIQQVQQQPMEIPTQETQQVFSNMPSNTPLTMDEAAVDRINQPVRSVLDEMGGEGAEEIPSTKDLRVLPDTPTSEEQVKEDSDIG